MKKKTGFTLAEVLITLAIIGIIAALVIPAVMTNFQFRNVGIRLSKFASTVENATRAYVVADAALPLADGSLASQQGFADYINNVFSISEAGANLTPAVGHSDITAAEIANLGAASVDWAGLVAALDQGPTDRNADPAPNEIILKDGTRARLFLLNFPADMTDDVMWGGHNNPGRAITGEPVLGIALDPIATGVPRTARRTFGFAITQNGYVFPAGPDSCLYDIVDSRWETRQETFAAGTNCGRSTVVAP